MEGPAFAVGAYIEARRAPDHALASTVGWWPIPRSHLIGRPPRLRPEAEELAEWLGDIVDTPFEGDPTDSPEALTPKQADRVFAVADRHHRCAPQPCPGPHRNGKGK